MKEIKDTLIDQIKNSFQEALNASFGEGEVVEIAKTSDENFGHYQCNSAMKLAPKLKMNPRKIAENLREKVLSYNNQMIKKVEVAGPGFINIWINEAYLELCIDRLVKDPKLGVHAVKKKRIVVDFSSPNVAKEMHVGHLRSTIIGDCLARVFEFLGHDVLRHNHIGDWGTSFGMLIQHMAEQNREEKLTLSDLMQLYREAKKRFDEDEEFKKRSQLRVVELQSGNKKSIALWENICDISRKAYNEIYDLLDVKLEEKGESFYNPVLSKVVKFYEDKELVTISDGAKCIYLDGFVNREGEKLPLMIQKSDGGYNYDTTDLAALAHRVQEEKADWIVIVVDAGQSIHFKMIFQAGILAGVYDPAKVRVDHVPFGMVLGQDGKKFKTRSGDIEKLIDLLTEAEVRAYAILKERNPDWNEDERKKVAKALGIGAVKYADLSSNRVSDYMFSYDKMLRFEGNTAAFVLYAYVRTESIKRKIGAEINSLISTTKVSLIHDSEISLALHLARFPEAIEAVVDDLMPNRLCDYLYELATQFNSFFRDCRVEGAPEQSSRLLLTEATNRVLKAGLYMLGLHTVERM